MTTEPVEAMELADMTFAQFQGNDPFFRMMQDVASFSLRVKLPMIGRWEDDDAAQRVGFRLYDYLADALTEAHFYSAGSIELKTTESDIKVAYIDPEYGFEIVLDPDGWLSINRAGSSLHRFHNWFVRLMPSAQGIVQMMVSATIEEIRRKTGYERKLTMQKGVFKWSVIAYGFTTAQGKPVRNLDLVRKALPLMPDGEGRLTTELVPQETLGRTEFTVHKWADPPTEGRREVYEVSAPSNNEWSSLWFDFMYAGDTYYDHKGDRFEFKPDRFISPRDLHKPYIQFFRDHALRGFLASVAENHRFHTTTGIIP